MTKIKIAQFGLGPIGIETIKLAARKPWVEIVGGIDIDPGKRGSTLDQLTGLPVLKSCKVYSSFEALCAEKQPQVVLHTAGSKAEEAIRQIEPIASRGVSVVSSCEELLFPNLRAAKAAAALDKLCREKGARVVGTGVNPGFVMDVVPVFMTGVSRDVESIYVERVVNASTRRMPLQKKIGSGLDPEHFRELFEQGKAGHAGFQESLALIAHSLGWKLDKVTETCDPVLADHEIQTDYFHVPKGMTCGLHQHAEGIVAGRPKIVLDLKMYLDAKDPHDLVRLVGDPELEVLVKNGVAGDRATVAALINTVPRILNAPPGLLLMTDLPVPCWK
jgi:hypothetical protein